MGNLVGACAFRERLSRRDLRWLLVRVIAEIEGRYAGLHRVPDLRAALERLRKLVQSESAS